MQQIIDSKNINKYTMKNYLLIFLFTFSFLACKDNKPARSIPAVQKQTNKSETPTRTGNTITQKVTVGANTENTNIDANTALAMMANEKNIKVLDVRTLAETSDGSYPNCLKIDYNSEQFRTEINKLDKNDIYIVYCRSGGRSKNAVSMMKALGFSKAYNMKDGFDAFDKASK